MLERPTLVWPPQIAFRAPSFRVEADAARLRDGSTGVRGTRAEQVLKTGRLTEAVRGFKVRRIPKLVRQGKGAILAPPNLDAVGRLRIE